MWATALGIGIWYLSSSLSGSSLTYTSVDNFLHAAGVQNGDISTANGCFLCGYIADLFGVLGDATEKFWTGMLDALWVIMIIGFGVFLFVHAAKHIYKAATETASGDTREKKLEFKSWFDKVWKQALRIMVVGVFIGGLGMGGTGALKIVSNITIKPVMFVGAELSMAATGISSAAQCNAMKVNSDASEDLLNPILQPFM